MATIAAIVGAAATAYGGYKSAQAQKAAAKNSQKPTTETTTPWNTSVDDLQYIQDEARRLYDDKSTWAAPPPRRGGGRGGGKSEGDPILKQIIAKGTKGTPTVDAAQQAIQRMLAPGGSRTGGTPGTPGKSAFDSSDLAGEVANPSSRWGKMKAQGATDAAILAKMNEFGKANPKSPLGQRLAGTPGTPGTKIPLGGNEILDDLYGRLGGVNYDEGNDLLKDFMGNDPGGHGSGGDGPRERGGGGIPGGGAGRLNYSGSGRSFGNSSGSDSGGDLRDSMAQGGFFADETRKFFGSSRLDPASDPTLAPYIAAIKADMIDAHKKETNDIGDDYDRVGMYGGSGYGIARGESSTGFDRALSGRLAEVYLGSRQSALDRQQNLLGLVSDRDKASMGDRTNRYGIDSEASSRAAATGAGAAAEAASRADQMKLAMRGQNLDAINALNRHSEFGLGQLGDLSSQLTGARLGAAGLAPGLEEGGYIGLNHALGASKNIDERRSAAANRRYQDDLDLWKFNSSQPGDMLDDYLRRSGAVGSMGGTRTSQGPGLSAGISPNSAAWMAGLGSAANSVGNYYASKKG